MTIEIVTWDDAWFKNDDYTEETASKLAPARTMSVGYVVADTKAGITLAMDTWDWSEKKDNFGTCAFIPKAMIVKREVLTVKGKKR